MVLRDDGRAGVTAELNESIAHISTLITKMQPREWGISASVSKSATFHFLSLHLIDFYVSHFLSLSRSLFPSFYIISKNNSDEIN
jgi:hypothetical protein